MSDTNSFEPTFHGAVTVGERGQVVIPAEVRKKFDIETGDKLLVFSHPTGQGLVMTKIDALEEMMQIFKRNIDLAKQEIAKTEK